MKKGFTLLELIVVIIIIGILATLGFTQYARMIERSRGAEGRSVLGAIRTQAAALWIERNNGAVAPVVPAGTFTAAAVGIGASAGMIASTCSGSAPSTSYYFSYAITQLPTNNGFTGTATRCTGTNGKQPGGPSATTLELATNFAAGTDVWGGTGGY
jgi:prepilin-type N-terminal cleavage/methylation domain-containing protein